jgi:hypothetical protein
MGERAAVERGHVGVRRVDARQQRACVREHDAADVGQLGGASSAGRAAQHRAADDPLQRADLLAHRGLRVAQLTRGGGERALVDHGDEGTHVAHLERAPAISVWHHRRAYSC